MDINLKKVFDLQWCRKLSFKIHGISCHIRNGDFVSASLCKNGDLTKFEVAMCVTYPPKKLRAACISCTGIARWKGVVNAAHGEASFRPPPSMESTSTLQEAETISVCVYTSVGLVLSFFDTIRLSTMRISYSFDISRLWIVVEDILVSDTIRVYIPFITFISR